MIKKTLFLITMIVGHIIGRRNTLLIRQQSICFMLCVILYSSLFYSYLFPFSSYSADTLSSEKKTNNKNQVDNKVQLKNLQQGIEEKEKSVKKQKQQHQTLLERLRQQENNIAQVSRTLREIQSTLTQLNKDIADVSTSISQLEKQQSIQQTLLAKQLNATFKQGKYSALRLILNGEAGRRDERILTYFNYLNHARTRSINTLKKIRTDLAGQKKILVQKKHRQTTLLNEKKEQQQKWETARTARKQTLTSLEKSLQKDQQSLTELKLNERRLRNKIANAERRAKARAKKEAQEAARMREQIKAKKQQAEQTGSQYTLSENERSLMARTGGLGPPKGQTIWPVRGEIRHRFGEALQGELRWKGMVIAATEGREVRAIAYGRVLLADWLQGYGLMVVVEHGRGDMSLYGYNQSILVNVGNEVKAGQAIALVGTSGGQGQPSLYFEIRRQGQTMNPQPWLDTP